MTLTIAIENILLDDQEPSQLILEGAVGKDKTDWAAEYRTLADSLGQDRDFASCLPYACLCKHF